MRRYWQYFKYVVRHKWYVTLECWKRGLIWRGLAHDLDKFRWRMFVDYARFFYNPDGTKKTIRDKTGYYKPTATGDQAFDLAWFGHTRRARHHWQYWCLQDDRDKLMCFRIPPVYVVEMFCDWIGAGRAQGTPDTQKWWQHNNGKMCFHEDTAKILDAIVRRPEFARVDFVKEFYRQSDEYLPVEGTKKAKK